MSTPIECYQRNLELGGFTYDKVQEDTVKRLDELFNQLTNQKKDNSWKKWLLPERKKNIQGLYLWGGVGRGKTYLMDIFYNQLPFENKLRTHFHRFMKLVHEELALIKCRKDPLKQVANKLGANIKVLCFDEFFVSDIADAMLLSGLLKELFAKGITLVTTSNIPPNELYQDGLQRARFLPAIELIKQHTNVINVDSGVDYRLRVLTQTQIYYYPLGPQALESLSKAFNQLCDADFAKCNSSLVILGREIKAQRVCVGIAWFQFAELCDGPRSQNDYIELAAQFHTLLIQDLPQFNQDLESQQGTDDDKARRFINLIDECYDRGVNVIICAQVPMQDLYPRGRLEFPFQRTLSRLQEMQSEEYLARAHKP